MGSKQLTNDQVLIEEVVRQEHEEYAPELSHEDYFEHFVAMQVLKNFELDFEELSDGIVGGGQDGGVDGLFVFVDSELLRDDFDYKKIRKSAIIDVYIFQSKISKRIEEAPLIKLKYFLEKITDLTIDEQEIINLFHADLADKVNQFKELVLNTAKQFPHYHFNIIYASMGETVSNGVEKKRIEVEEAAKRFDKNTKAECRLINAGDLLTIARQEPTTTFTLNLVAHPMQQKDGEALICLVELKAFYDLISDEKDDLRRGLFEDNVRDYQGSVEVNQAIADSLRSNYPEDFWWLNNGITILCQRADSKGQTLTIEAPQIVNGFQTSHEIHNYFVFLNKNQKDKETRSVLVRVIVNSDESSRNRVIKATNSQTGVQPASLRSTDKIHRDIEDYFVSNTNLYYDRKKNKYRNLGKKQSSIVGISQLAQAVMAMLLGEPDEARARPSSLLKDDDRYSKVFNDQYPLELFRACAETLKNVEAKLMDAKYGFTGKDKNNLKFYILQAISILATGKSNPSASELSELTAYEIQGLLETAITIAEESYKTSGADDKAAKGPELKSIVAEGALAEAGREG